MCKSLERIEKLNINSRDNKISRIQTDFVIIFICPPWLMCKVAIWPLSHIGSQPLSLIFFVEILETFWNSSKILFFCLFIHVYVVCLQQCSQADERFNFVELHCVRYFIVTFPDVQKNVWIINDRQVYLHRKRFGFHPHHCLNEIRWLNRVNGRHELRTKETVLFERLFLP